MDYDKNMSNILVLKSQKVRKKVEDIELTSFKNIIVLIIHVVIVRIGSQEIPKW